MEAHCAVMVRIRGPDPKSRKMLRHAFHASESGETTLSASGLLLPIAGKSAAAVTCASIVEPYLSPSDLADQDSIKLVRGATLEVLLQAPPSSNEFGSTPLWLPAQILKLVHVKRASEAVRSLLDVQGGDELWEMGWSVANPQESRPENATVSDFSRSKEGAVPKTTATLAAAFTRIAVLSVQANTTELMLSSVCTKGDVVRAIGSPFGALSPLHFFNSVSVGNVSNCWPSSSRLILMADIRALPGMEGGPVFDAAGNLVGILLRPLRQRSSGVEVQLILPAKVLASELEELGFNVMYNIFDNEKLQSNKHIQMALSSIVLLTTSNGSWASGTLLNKSGLILTNAHLLEPWRFRRLTVDPLLRDDFIEVANVSNRGQYSPVQVRLERQQRRSWHFATVVFVSHGPLDVALLQLTSVPYELEPIPVDTTEPVPGSAVAVIGHGLFGPRTGKNRFSLALTSFL
ncbi:glyoxysomal processing protease, glyoxysomal-like [Selaginella moellendorffii]|uniref:glyoxysomal processing protease, glyoxysomal-like n=1 Tax=Selaginella moellendorffii TaxID=88036 RepID=UPI000D1CD1B8|nr:glyoxysomal processing protease, glyoxysomal-like [Selaginella moellendorffii]|eukprot:XP_024526837.1 glyoxysomal processing protease, glyoxysomal-like [Selaginella moellendorffii]